MNDKIDRLWKTFTGRYGAFQLKDGQDAAYVKKSYEIAFQHVSEAQLMEAAKQYMSNSRYERWPSTGDLQEILKDIRKLTGPSRRDEYAGMSAEWNRDYDAFCDWWATIPLFVGRNGEPLARKDEIFAEFMSRQRGNFAVLAVKAWRMEISKHWSVAVSSHLDRMTRVFKRSA